MHMLSYTKWEDWSVVTITIVSSVFRWMYVQYMNDLYINEYLFVSNHS